MKIDFTQVLKMINGEPIKNDTEDLTLSFISTNALLSEIKDEQQSGEQKLEGYLLAKKIYAEKTVDLTVEEISNLKKRISKLYAPVVSGQAWEMLENKGGSNG